MTRQLKIAAAQVQSQGGPSQTLSRIERQARAAQAQSAQLLLLSEGVLHGYDYGMTAQSIDQVAQPLTGPDAQRLGDLAVTYKMVILAGMFERDETASPVIYNSMIVAWPDGRIESARKHVLTAMEKNAGLTPGPTAVKIIDVQDVHCAIIICADCSIPNLHENLRAREADFRLCPTGGGGSFDDMIHESDLLTDAGQEKYTRRRTHVFRPEAILNHTDCPYTGFASANALGPIGQSTFHQGHCMIVDENRVMRAQIPGTTIIEHIQDQIICVNLNFSDHKSASTQK